MEGSSYSHSRPQPFAAGKKPPRFPSNGGNAAFFTTSYDDVFGGPPTFAALAPRREDYSEIFGAFRSSSRAAASIPVLDLPAISAGADSGASTLGYSDVFGGFDDVDFAVPYDELFRPFDASGDCSSDEAWTPAGTESLSDDSDPFALSEKSPCFSDGNSHQSLDDKQFNVSYHKVNSATSTSVPSMIHVAQLNDVPGYTCVVEETISLKEMKNDRFCSTIGDDIIYNGDPSSDKSLKHTDQTMSHGDPSTIGDDESQKHTDQTMSHVSHDDVDDLRSFDGAHRSGRASSASTSNVNSTFLSVSDVNLRMEPTHLPPSIPSERKGDFTTLWADHRDSESYGFEATADGSLPFYDMEVDASSSAAASSAAIKDAMERAQVKLKAAKVSMDRKNLSFKIDVKGGEKVQMVHDGYASKGEQFSTKTFGAPANNKVKMSAEDRHVTNVSQNLSSSSTVEQHFGVTKKLAERNNGKKRSSVMDTAFTGEAGEWKEATQYYEFVNNDTARLAPQWPKNGDGKTAALKQQDSDDEHNYGSADEAYAPEENRRRLKATKAVSRQEYYEKMVKVAQEVHNSTIGGHVETQTRLTAEARGTLKQHNGKQERDETQAQQVEEKKLEESIRNQEDEIRLRNAPENEEIKQKETETCHRDQNDAHRNGAHQSRVQEVVDSKEQERKIRKSCQWGSCEERAQETDLGKKNERGVRKACERQLEKKQAGTPKQTKDNESWEVDDNRSKEAFDIGFGAEVVQKACESQENGKMQDLRQRKAGDNRLKEACDNVLGGEILQKNRQTHQRKLECEKSKEALDGIFSEERLQRTSGVQENGKTKALQQIYEYENHAGEAVELEEGVKYKEAPEKEKIKQRLDEAQKLVVDCRKSENSKKQATGEAKLEKSTKEGYVGSESLQTGELEETCKIPDLTGDNDNQKFMHRSRVKADQTDKDRASYSSPETELSVKDEHLKLPNGSKLKEKDFELDNMTFNLKSPQVKAHDSQAIPAKKDDADCITLPLGKKSKLETVESADVLIDEIQMRSTVGSMGASDNDLTRTTHAHETPHVKYSYATYDGVSTSKGHTLNHENEKVGPSFSDRKLVDLKLEGEEKREVPGQCHGVYDKLDKVRFTPPEGTSGSNEQLRRKETAPASVPERTENIQKRRFELPTRGQCTERKGKIIQEEKKRENERDLEQEQLAKLEEEKEREREREKDKMAVESAIREARERAYEDSRGRAEKATLERATDEARQRAMAEARERLEKACQEARERSLTDKATEARLRAERAAVERATVEARQRAFEKTMAERVTLEARGRMQRSVSEKYSSEKDVAMTMRQSSMPSISERSEGADGEPAQRCKARLERHQRTVERVAIALAEKNMRDLLAQKEQAERNRFAETLDAEIKRWSSGKEGNLRALLSTLQYILGADSGWHPIPLTEVITAAAVKKAYRKATLYVHPDKLQQRGATVQQKYLCEKVFDLLKAAWSRFNSEEK